jgi:hypothetical protein
MVKSKIQLLGCQEDPSYMISISACSPAFSLKRTVYRLQEEADGKADVEGLQIYRFLSVVDICCWNNYLKKKTKES